MVAVLAFLLFTVAVALATWDTWRTTSPVEDEVWLAEDDPRRVR